MKSHLFASESVSEGHPDKISDQISDAVLDSFIKKDKKARVACETLITTNLVVLAGEISLPFEEENIKSLVREVIKDIGYDDKAKGFDYKDCKILVCFDKQSADISLGVDQEGGVLGAGDQGIMFGYAVNETKELMPLSISLSHKLVRNLASSRKKNEVPFLRPDSKSQVTVEYNEKGEVFRIENITISTQHAEDVKQKQIHEFLQDQIISTTIPKNLVDKNTKFLFNPTGRFVVGGPEGDCGLTGRKIIVDTYGGHGAHGGGAFSGKDPSKVDRTAAYMSRYIAKNVVASGLASRCLIQLSYAIGVSEPIHVMVNTFNTSSISDDVFVKAIKKIWNLTPSGMIDHLDLLNTSFLKTSVYGHFGREGEGFLWEETKDAEKFKDTVQTLK